MKPLLQMVRPAVRELAGYVPGRQPPPGRRVIKLNTNENPYPPAPAVTAALRRALADDARLRLYPNPTSSALRQAAARCYGLQPEQVLAGNGSDELLRLVLETFVDPGEKVGFLDPSYSLYPVLISLRAAVAAPRPLDWQNPEKEVDLEGVKLFLLTSPNAPYGVPFGNHYLKALADRLDGILVVDEAYADFAADNALELLASCPNLVITRTFSKSYALAALRVGLAFAHREIIAQMDKARDSYNLDYLAQEAALAALGDQEYLRDTRERICRTREVFSRELQKLGFTVCPSATNFLFCWPPPGMAAAAIYRYLADRQILVRYFAHPPLDRGLRISIGTGEEMAALLEAIRQYNAQEEK